jgi:hypothetical protein
MTGGYGNGKRSRTTPEDTTLDTFFNVLTTPAGGGAHNGVIDTNTLMTQVFCQDNGLGPGLQGLPCVAITEHGNRQGPGFFGGPEVSGLFSELFRSFPDVALTPISDLRLYSPYTPPDYSPVTIGVQVDLTGSYQQQWFGKFVPPGKKSHYSPPLSDLKPAPTPPYKTVSIPAVAVFNFDANHKVTQLAIYTDRYHFVPQVALSSLHITNVEMANVLENLTTPRKP